MTTRERYLIAAAAGVIVAIAFYIFSFLESYQKGFSLSIFDPAYLFGMIFRLFLSALAAIVWIYLHQDTNSRIAIFELGLLAPVALTTLLLQATDKVENMSILLGDDIAINFQCTPANKVSSEIQWRPFERPALDETARISEFNTFINTIRYTIEDFSDKYSTLNAFKDGFLGRHIAYYGPTLYSKKYLKTPPDNIDEISETNAYFVIIASEKGKENSRNRIEEFIRQNKSLSLEVFPPFRGNRNLAITSGSWLSKKEAIKAASLAKECKLAKDVYLWRYPYSDSKYN